MTKILFLEGLVRVAFDNEQVIGKCYSVKANQNSVLGSVISSNAYLVIDTDSKIQSNLHHALSNRMLMEVDDPLIILILESFNKHNDIFQPTRNELMSERIKVLQNIATCNGDAISDHISKYGNKKLHGSVSKVCNECNEKASMTQRNCRICKGKLVQQNVSLDNRPDNKINPSSHFKSKETGNNIEVILGENLT